MVNAVTTPPGPQAPPPQDHRDQECDVVVADGDVLDTRDQVVPHDLAHMRAGVGQRHAWAGGGKQRHAPHIAAGGDHVARGRVDLLEQGDFIDQLPGHRRTGPLHVHQHMLGLRAGADQTPMAGRAGGIGDLRPLRNVVGERLLDLAQRGRCDFPVAPEQRDLERPQASLTGRQRIVQVDAAVVMMVMPNRD
jgi:hypothetical protein